LDHLQAIETQAAERYLLGELAASDAEAFELHFFECQLCASAVDSGDRFVTAAQDYFRQPATVATPAAPATPKRSFSDLMAAIFRPAFAMPALAALLLLIGYQNAVVIPGMKQILNTARALPAVQLIGASRGDESVVHIPAETPFLSLAADIPPGTPFQQYLCVITKAGREVSRSINPAPAEGQPITVLIPAGQLSGGSHVLTLYGVGPQGERSDKISTYPFTVQIK
jgi:hypothetical protein